MAALLSVAATPAEAWDTREPLAEEPRRNAVAVFLGAGVDRDMSETFSRAPGDWSRDFVVAGAFSRELARPLPQLGIEAEVMYAFHFGRESYHEGALGLYGRWHSFPWDRVIDTTLALGVGPSITSKHPKLEAQRGSDDRSRLLNQFNVELTFADPDRPDWEMLLRVQHRSGVFGMFNGVGDASNFISVGLRHRFADP